MHSSGRATFSPPRIQSGLFSWVLAMKTTPGPQPTAHKGKFMRRKRGERVSSRCSREVGLAVLRPVLNLTCHSFWGSCVACGLERTRDGRRDKCNQVKDVGHRFLSPSEYLFSLQTIGGMSLTLSPNSQYNPTSPSSPHSSELCPGAQGEKDHVKHKA